MKRILMALSLLAAVLLVGSTFADAAEAAKHGTRRSVKHRKQRVRKPARHQTTGKSHRSRSHRGKAQASPHAPAAQPAPIAPSAPAATH
jgi:Ni/Co efflux regulator RcnB